MDPNIAPYSPEWVEAKYQELAPQVEAMVKQIYGANRGARFGAQYATIAQRLAALRNEIATDAATKLGTIQETQRQEKVAETARESAAKRETAEKMREENVAATVRGQQRSWNELDYQKAMDNYNRMQNAQKKFQFEMSTGNVSPETLTSLGYTPEQIASMTGGSKGGGAPATPLGGDWAGTGSTFKANYGDVSGGGGYGRGFSSYMPPPMPSGVPSYSYSGYPSPGTYGSNSDRYGNNGVYDSPQGYDYDASNRWSGTINAGTPQEFAKVPGQVANRFQDLWAARPW